MTLRTILVSAVCVIALSPTAALADLAVAALDGKQVRAGDGLPMVPTPDSVQIIAFSGSTAPRVIGKIEVCGTMIGPPVSVAVAPDYSFALSTCPQKIGADSKLAPDDSVAVIGLDDPTHPKLLQTAHAGAGATGVFLDRKAGIALVTGTGDDSVTLFTIKDRQLTPVSKVTLEAKAEPRDVIVAPDGKTAWALRFGDAKVTKLKIDGTTLSRVADYPVGVQPDGGIMTADARFLLNNNFKGAPTTTAGNGATTVLDTRTGELVDALEVGPTPEHVVLSADGRYAAIVVANGSATVKTAKNFDTVLGKLLVLSVSKTGKLAKVAEASTGHACQGATWSDDGKAILLECSVERDIEVYHFDGGALTRDTAATLTFDSRPGAIATAKTR